MSLIEFFEKKARMNKPNYIVIHHSKGPDHVTRDFEAIRKYHIEVNGWLDIGYHFLLDEVNGSVEIISGRAPENVGAHALGFNDHSIGICMVGDFDIKPPPMKKVIKLVNLIRAVQATFEIKTAHVIGHRETYVLREQPIEKTCPGRAFDMDDLREAIK